MNPAALRNEDKASAPVLYMALESLGHSRSSLISPTGSGSAATCSSPCAMASMSFSFRVSRSSSRKVRITAALLASRLEEQLIDLPTGEHKKAEYLKINPNGLVPTLQDGDRILCESNAIAKYLADLNPENNLLPREPMARADITRWQHWEQAPWVPALVIVIRENVFKPLWGQSPDASEIARGEGVIHKVAPVLDAHLKGRSYLLGTA